MRTRGCNLDGGKRRSIAGGALAVAAALCLLLSPADLRGADDPANGDPPASDGLRCTVEDRGVAIEWNIQFFVPIRGWVLYRDGSPIANLAPEEMDYFDIDPPAGAVTYALEAIGMDGTIAEVARCQVEVGDTGLRCRARDRSVLIEWDPLLIDVVVREFRVYRNGDLVGTAPRDALSFVDTVPDLGRYRWAVRAVISEETAFLVGTCSLAIECFGLATSVDGLSVALNWNIDGPFPSTDPFPIVPMFVIQRNDEIVGKTTEGSYIDTVPRPGVWTYRVWFDLGTGGAPIYLIAACIVVVPGEGIPGPVDLACLVLQVPGDPIPLDEAVGEAGPGLDSDGDGIADSVLPPAAVLLQWVNPIAYDRIIVARNKAIIATLPGDATNFVDEVGTGGTFLYSVEGVVGGVASEPARCEVEVPPGFVPPPQDFKCVLLDRILDPADPTNPGGGVEGDDGIISPLPVVLLSWWNPVRYASILISRDGELIAELEGSSTLYRDIPVPGNVHVYGIQGIVWDGTSSPTVECTVGGVALPPVEDLVCLTPEVSPDILPEASVRMSWRNPIRYEAIVIFENGELAVRLEGTEESWIRSGLAPGLYLYEVVGILGSEKAPPAMCQVFIDGPPERNLLYFEPTSAEPLPEPVADEPPTTIPNYPGNRVTCLAANSDPIQGWSFGVQSDPHFVVPKSVDLEDTATQALQGGQGPDFLHLATIPEEGGVVMAVVIDTGANTDPFETLPPARAHRLLHIEYAAGPSGLAGDVYPVRYTHTLGSPPVQVLFVVDGFEVAPRTLAGWVSIPGPRFIRGDATDDGTLDLSDAVAVLGWLFLGKEEPGCLEAANANGSAAVNIADPIYVLQYLFNGGSAPPHPYPRCGWAPVPLGCKEYDSCPATEPALP